ncbi:MAG TPA: hypothetical protein VFA67_05535 [Candidatus Sulfotelmatobacter sp.]|jgi:cytochrome c-type biogenesis protein CcmH/NrfF|nr:hypothetical protein [Candidatus Sulfotelmatobacter sp.]
MSKPVARILVVIARPGFAARRKINQQGALSVKAMTEVADMSSETHCVSALESQITDSSGWIREDDLAHQVEQSAACGEL